MHILLVCEAPIKVRRSFAAFFRSFAAVLLPSTLLDTIYNYDGVGRLQVLVGPAERPPLQVASPNTLEVTVELIGLQLEPWEIQQRRHCRAFSERRHPSDLPAGLSALRCQRHAPFACTLLYIMMNVNEWDGCWYDDDDDIIINGAFLFIDFIPNKTLPVYFLFIIIIIYIIRESLVAFRWWEDVCCLSFLFSSLGGPGHWHEQPKAPWTRCI